MKFTREELDSLEYLTQDPDMFKAIIKVSEYHVKRVEEELLNASIEKGPEKIMALKCKADGARKQHDFLCGIRTFIKNRKPE